MHVLYRNCQTDPTCVQCDTCYRNSDHVGHEVYFHHASPGGCCDCGDLEAWKQSGCCSAHSGPDIGQDPVDNLPSHMRTPARVVFREAINLISEACFHAVQGFNRAEVCVSAIVDRGLSAFHLIFADMANICLVPCSLNSTIASSLLQTARLVLALSNFTTMMSILSIMLQMHFLHCRSQRQQYVGSLLISK